MIPSCIRAIPAFVRAARGGYPRPTSTAPTACQKAAMLGAEPRPRGLDVPEQVVRDAEVDRATRQGRRLRPAPELAGFLRQDADPGYLHLVPPHPVVLEARAYDC